MKFNRLFIALFLFVSFTVSAQNRSVFFVGHSLCKRDMPQMLASLADDAGVGYNFDYQLIWGACLSKNWDEHNGPLVNGSDARLALNSGDYDVLVMMEGIPLDEVFNGPGWGCDYKSSTVAGWFYDLARNGSPGTQGFIIEPWNEFDRDAPTGHQDWLALNASQEPLFKQLVDEVQSDYPQHDPLCIIPLRQCVEALVKAIDNGEVPGLNDRLDIFDWQADDPQHTFHTNELGQYFSALVHFTAIYGLNPTGLTHQTFDEDGYPYLAPATETAHKMQQIVWEVFQNYPSACAPAVGLGGPNESNLEIYPNPSTGWIQLSEKGQVRVQNAAGIKVYEGLSQERINLGHLPAGLYYLSVENSGKRIHKKLILL